MGSHKSKRPSSSSLLIFFISFFIFFSFVVSETIKLAPALYVFGDSTVDVGNNNNFDTFSKANFPPYGIDFADGATGRPTNGFNMADIIALSLGLIIPPAIRSVDLKTYNSDDGFNYASSSSGILPDTGTNMFKGVMSLGEQIEKFNKTIQEYLKPRLKSPSNLEKHLSKSIFFLVTGSNDFSLNLLMSNRSIDRLQFSKDLVQKYASQLQKLYYLGGRKFVVFEVDAMGCSPSSVLKAFPKNPNKCVDDLNVLASNYNKLLNQMLQQLASTLKGAAYIIGRNYDFTYQLAQHPAKFGLKEAFKPCCNTTSVGVCDAKKPIACKNRDSYAYFDEFHTTQAANMVMASLCFSSAGACFPYNIKQLADL
ncbi:GDSL esterase/lipase At1g71691-like [Humulus lupulus]|uniref:GDSL esterase/lipase At1g71691-like n=1 Tax=Humulus lupulus TaxID=3486 RepID=UPI002B408B95|nr:GDSL esterase/lipase At1g71691-like [Humulus lupulus]